MAAKHNRKLVLGAVALVPGRVRHSASAATEVRDEVEAMMVQHGFLTGAPFEWIGLILRYGHYNAEAPELESINVKDGDLPVSIELDMHELQGVSKEQVRRQFREATLKAIVEVGKKYGLSTAPFEDALLQ
jgi:hypothetical protein